MRTFGVVAFFVALLVVIGVGPVAGAFQHDPAAATAGLSPDARRLVDESFRDIPPGAARDYHTHLLTLDTSATGGYVNVEKLTWRRPIARLQTAIYMSAAGIEDLDRADAQYLERLMGLIRSTPNHGKHFLLAFDQHYRPDGTVDRERSEFYVPNDYVWEVCQKHPDLFIPVISVHPYRPDALEELDRWGRRGVKLIKWLPNAQGIDASDPRLDPYYAKVREYDMTILTHVGEEQAVKAEEFQRLGNPLLFRRPLDQGTRIIMAHGASLGTDEDLDHLGTGRLPSYQLVLRLLKEPRYDGLLYVDISAITQVNRAPAPLLAFLRDETLHRRLVNGSDYPIPAVNILIQLHQLESAGLIAQEDVAPLREIYRANPLLFDFVLKRRLRDPRTGRGFPASVFVTGAGLPG